MNFRSGIFLMLSGVLSALICGGCNAEWVYKRDARVIVEVERDKGVRAGDERPAQVYLDFSKVLGEAETERGVDISSVKVVRISNSGEALDYGDWSYAEKEFDVPFRWYDDAIPYEFPEYEGSLDATNGKYRGWRIRRRWGYFYDSIGSWESGHLVWIHRELEEPAGRYAIYFDFLEEGEQPYCVPSRGFIGDGLNRCVKRGAETTTGLIHSRIDLDDYDGDGLVDIVVGCSRGGIVWYPNVGTKREAKFAYSKMIFTRDGKPLDVGWTATPKVYDFNGDGKKDLLVGAERNRIAFFENVGTNGEREYVYKGLLKDDKGQFIAVPYLPCPEGLLEDGSQVYTRDYYPVLDFADIDGDGREDMFAGGYVTGRLFYYRNTGQNNDGTPQLRYMGPLEADGKIIDVGWTAAPCFYDFDSDGELELVVGNMKMSAGGGDSASSEHFVHYYDDAGGIDFTEKAVPKEGEFPAASLTTPRAADLNGDGLADLVVSYGSKISIYYNVGTKEKPKFAAHSGIIEIPWSSDGLDAYQFMDYNGDGLKDAVKGWRVRLNDGKGNPWDFEEGFDVADKDEIDLHLSGIGDDWQFRRLFDLDGDGDIDLMNADHSGYVWFHENRGTTKQPDFDKNGLRLKRSDGEYVRVGPAVQEGQTAAFDKLQGARTTYTVGDFDKDGFNDMVVGDTFGYVRYFHNSGRKGSLCFDEPAMVTKMGNRLVPCASDWNNDGWLDVVMVSSPTAAYVSLNEGKSCNPDKQFMARGAIVVPGAPYGAGAPVAVTDLNEDGDEDLIFYTPYRYCTWVENSFIKHGYAEGHIVKFEENSEAK